MGTRAPPKRKPTLCSSSQRITPLAASRPNALPPDSTMACTFSTTFSGASSSVSRVPGAAPRTSTPATTPSPASTTVHPVGRPVTVMCPTLSPETAVSVSLFAGAAP